MGLLDAYLHPEAFHGHGQTSRFFEGWYVKLVSADKAQRWAVIPGLFLGPDGQGEAFVQVLDGATRRSWYHCYQAGDFEARADRFEVRVGPNTFSPAGLTLELSGGPLKGTLRFGAFNAWPVTVASPGIMGWYAYVPFMECYHGVVSLFHTLQGSLEVEGVPTSFESGVGYLEKDWGRAFPSGYVWMQSNHFEGGPASLVASAAVIPWLGTSFPGFIAGLWCGGRLHRFATYTGARLEQLTVDDAEVHLTLADAAERLTLSCQRKGGGLLHAPVRTQMHRRVEESLDAEVQVRLSTLKGQTLFEGLGRVAGLEVHGETERLVRLARAV